jgi:SAM-dependent methyltransferase
VGEPLRLHLGCGTTHLPGFVNCDLYPGPHVDEAFDVQKTWPFDDNAASDIYASHLLEHLVDHETFFQEAWRVLHPNGSLLLRLPYGGHKAAWWDLTHVRPWFAETFCAFQPGYGEAIGNPQHVAWRHYFGIQAVDLRISGKFARLLRWRLARKWFFAVADNIPNAIEELWAHLYALKTPDDVAMYRAARLGNVVLCRWVVYRHQLEGHALPKGAHDTLIPLAESDAVNGYHSWRW